MSKPADLFGHRFGRLKAMACIGSKNGSRLWRCRCDCGGEAQVTARDLGAGKTRSCGCLQRESSKTASLRHGWSGSSTHNIWMGMLDRCGNPKARRYADYGGRGVFVCDRWKSFENFIADMGERPKGMSLDRRDVNGPYSPDNCRWATRIEQANNSRTNHTICCRGESHTMSEWATLRGMNYSTLRDRIAKGWDPEQALGYIHRPNRERYLCKSKR